MTEETKSSSDTRSPVVEGEKLGERALHSETAPISSDSVDSYTRQSIKDASQHLLRYGQLDADTKPKLYQTAVLEREELDRILEPFDLSLRLDDMRGLIVLVIRDSLGGCESGREIAGEGGGENAGTEARDEWSHPLVRRQRLTLEQSLLLAILRELFVAHEVESGIGISECIVSLDELQHSLQLYLGDMGSESAEDRRLRTLLDKLKGHGVVSDIDQYEQVRIKPLITHLANPSNLSLLLESFRRQAAADSDDEGGLASPHRAGTTAGDNAQETGNTQ
ncbi:MAG: DUF4194 domain-containing protein [Pseudomonadota bacterium]